MAITATDYDRALIGALDDAEKFGRTLFEQIRIKERAAEAALQGGEIASVSGAGWSSSQNTTGHTVKEVAHIWTTIRQHCTTALATLATAGTEATNAAVYALIAAALPRRFTESFQDFSELRTR